METPWWKALYLSQDGVASIRRSGINGNKIELAEKNLHHIPPSFQQSLLFVEVELMETQDENYSFLVGQLQQCVASIRRSGINGNAFMTLIVVIHWISRFYS